MTHGRDLRNRIAVMKHFQRLGIGFTSEGLQEGLHEFCNISWYAHVGEATPSVFAAGERVPLLPVLFQGMTYYGVGWYTAWDLLFGGTGFHESVLPTRRDFAQLCFGTHLFWTKIADRTVRNVVRTEKGWDVEYTEGGRLEGDLAGMKVPDMTFVL